MKNIEPRRAPAQKRAKESIERIFSATKHLLDTVGIDQLSTNRIAETAEISTGAIYNFFPNKEAILYSMVDSWLTQLRESYASVSAELDQYATPYEWIDRVVRRNEVLYDQEPIIARHYNAMTVLPALRELDARHDAEVAEILADAQQFFAPSLDRQQAQANAMTMVQMIHGVLSNAVSQNAAYAEKMRADLRFCLACLTGKYLL